MSIKVEDKVKVIFEDSIYQGKVGEIVIDNTDKEWTRDYRVHLEGRDEFNYGFDKSELELVENE